MICEQKRMSSATFLADTNTSCAVTQHSQVLLPASHRCLTRLSAYM